MSETLRVVAAYNRWANEKVFARCREIDAAVLDAEAKGTLGSVAETLGHLVLVEDNYLNVVRGTDPLHGHKDIPTFLAWYRDHDLAWYGERVATLDADYEQLVAEADEAFLAVEFKLPWFKSPMTRRDGILQGLLHATHHRAQVFSALGRHGIPVPDLDLPNMLDERAAPA